jgi:uncharacterized membrane protein YfcA
LLDFIDSITTGAPGAFIGFFLTGFVPVSYLLVVIGIIVLYESYMLLNGSRTKEENIKVNEIVEDPKLEGGEDSNPMSAHTQEKLLL